MLVRKLYKRGNSYGTTLPQELVQGQGNPRNLIFEFDFGSARWHIYVEDEKEG